MKTGPLMRNQLRRDCKLRLFWVLAIKLAELAGKGVFVVTSATGTHLCRWNTI